MINIFLKTLLWLALLCCFILISIVCGDYFGWLRWQQGLLVIGLIAATLLIQWGWRRWKLTRYLKSLSVGKALNFNAEKAFREGLLAFKRDQQLSKRALTKKTWFIGISFNAEDSLDVKRGVLLANNQANMQIRLVQLDKVFVLQFDFKSRLLLDREMELYQRYLAVFEKNFKAAINGFLYGTQAYAFEKNDALSLANFADNTQKIITKTVETTQKNYPISFILTDIMDIPGYPAFIVRLSRKIKSMLLGWQASQFEFYNSEAWSEQKDQILAQWLIRVEYSFATHLSVRSVEAYQFLTHLQQQLANIQCVFDQVSDAADVVLAGIYWVETLDKVSATHVKSFTNTLFNKQLRSEIQPQLIVAAQHNKNVRSTTTLATYLCVMAAIWMYGCYSYTKERQALLEQIDHFPKKIFFYHDLVPDLMSIGVYKTIIDQLGNDLTNNNMRLMHFHAGFYQLRENYIRTYVDYFNKYVLKQVDANLTQVISTPDFQTDPVLRGKIIFHVMNRLNLLQAKLHHQPLVGLAGPELWLKTTTAFNTSPHYLFSSLYLTYITETKNDRALQAEYTYLLEVAALLGLDKDNFHWLPAYLNAQSKITPITLNALWGGSRLIPIDNTIIEPVDTFDGSQAIINFWQCFPQAFSLVTVNSEQKKANFEIWYQMQRYAHWTKFLSDFPRGYLTLNNIGEWNQQYVKMASGQGISQVFLKLVATQFSDELTQKSRLTLSEPAWLTLAGKVITVLNYGLNHNKVSTVKESMLNLKSLIQFAKERGTTSPEEQAENFYFNSFDEKGLAANEFYKYNQALTKLYVPVMLTEAAYQNSKGIYAGGSGQFIDAVTLEQSMEQQFNTVNLDNIIFWNIYRVPLEFYVRYVNYLSANFLNQAWQNNVLTQLQNTPELFMSDLMFGESGLFWTFYNKYLGDYFKINVGTVTPKFYLNIAYPFTDDFYRLLLSASARYSMLKQQDLYKKYFANEATPATTLPPLPAPDAMPDASVTPVPMITALPPNLNKEATLQPQQITLLAECVKGNFELTNYNFPIQKVLPMPLSDCGKVTLRVYFGDFYLEKNYLSSTGLLDFLTSIQNNSLRFTAQDFPNNAADLKQYHIETLSLNYQLNGLSSIIEQYKAYLKMQTNFSNQQKSYTSIMDLPNVIAYNNALDKTSLKGALSDSM